MAIKKFQYRLGKILEFTKVQKKSKLAELELLKYTLRLEQNKLIELLDKRTNSFQFVDTPALGELADHFRDLQKNIIAKQRAKIQTVQSQVEQLQLDLLEFEKKIKILEELKTKKMTAWMEHNQKMADQELDDIVSQAWGRHTR